MVNVGNDAEIANVFLVWQVFISSVFKYLVRNIIIQFTGFVKGAANPNREIMQHCQ